MTDHRRIADRLAADITAGRLRPGQRLPTQRAFAHAEGIAASTAGRVYGELVRRGLIAGEVGRGSFVRVASPSPGPALAEPPAARVDLETNYPVLPDQHRLLAPALAALAGLPDALAATLRAGGPRALAPAREAAAEGLARPGWRPDPASLLFAGNGRQALAAAFSALVPVGGRIGVEALTYPVARAVAAQLGLVAVPVATDAEGLRPDALRAAHRDGPLHALYLQPTLHNPLGTTMPARRRGEVAATLARLGVVAVEDTVYAFLAPEAPPPLAALTPERVVLVDSLSKRIGPGLTLGFLSAPRRLLPRLAAALRSGAWGPGAFSLEMGLRWMADGTAEALGAAKRADAAARQALAARHLAGLDWRADPAAYHGLLAMPPGWRAEAFATAAARRGIAVTPAAAFAVRPAHAPDAVRIALADPPMEVLDAALTELAVIARQPPPA